MPRSSPSTHVWNRLTVAVCLAVALYLLTFPLQDFDTFWHLAYGRAMVESGSFINHEIFSYTASGKYLGSHSQLAQVLLYAVWAIGGANALLLLKLLAAATVFMLIVATARLFEAGAPAGAALALTALAVGIGRVVERPELFSVLLQALLIWLLFRARRSDYPGRELWAIPPVLVVWDYLHGAVYGLIVLLTFVGAEMIRTRLSARADSACSVMNSATAVSRRLLPWTGVSLLAMALHPNGLFAYAGFLRVGSSPEFRMYGEFMAPTLSAQFLPFWAFTTVLAGLLIWRFRYIDLTAFALLLPFLVLTLTYNRVILAFCLAAVPAASQALASLVKSGGDRARGRLLTAGFWLVFLGGIVLYKNYLVIDVFRFGTGVNANVFPIGSARFVVERSLTGNMYNMNAYGGYLAFALAPERKIFSYNQPGVFTALFDYLHKPASRREWSFDYAIVGDALEFSMFQREGYVTVYHEPTAAVMVRSDERNAGLIEKFRVHHFNPLLPDDRLMARGLSPVSGLRLLREMADYLAFREDARIAALFAQLLKESPVLSGEEERRALVGSVMRYNSGSAALLAVYEEIFGGKEAAAVPGRQ